MGNQHADVHLVALESLLDEIIELLEQHGEDHWAGWLRTSRQRLAAGDASGLDHLLSAFGGTGSFNDLTVMRLNGHQIDSSKEDDINERLGRVRSEVWTEATALHQALGSTQ
jgi:hypothetical protein